MFALHGNGVGSGIAIGRARVLYKPGQEVPAYDIGKEAVDQEVARYRKAVEDAQRGLSIILDGLPDEGAGEVRAILHAHLLMLQDPELSEEPVRLIRAQKINAEAALQQHADHLESVFNEIDDPYLSSKSADVAQAINRLWESWSATRESLPVSTAVSLTARSSVPTTWLPRIPWI